MKGRIEQRLPERQRSTVCTPGSSAYDQPNAPRSSRFRRAGFLPCRSTVGSASGSRTSKVGRFESVARLTAQVMDRLGRAQFPFGGGAGLADLIDAGANDAAAPCSAASDKNEIEARFPRRHHLRG